MLDFPAWLHEMNRTKFNEKKKYKRKEKKTHAETHVRKNITSTKHWIRPASYVFDNEFLNFFCFFLLCLCYTRIHFKTDEENNQNTHSTMYKLSWYIKSIIYNEFSWSWRERVDEFQVWKIENTRWYRNRTKKNSATQFGI